MLTYYFNFSDNCISMLHHRWLLNVDLLFVVLFFITPLFCKRIIYY